MMRSPDAISITGMKLAIISKAASLWKFVFVGYGVGSGLRAVQLAAAALRAKPTLRHSLHLPASSQRLC
ncbi:hypothetical protein [Brucella sp. NBRC 12950]|uniref:hypothetical protein n=1 Tax=Brucella sp. NBRC 12950 TaxID=2994518 RepID=UPI0025524C6C|nr:hypothetical protein [Brucella sp. NBRC 12950]